MLKPETHYLFRFIGLGVGLHPLVCFKAPTGDSREVKAENHWPKTWIPGPQYLDTCKIKNTWTNPSTVFTVRMLFIVFHKERFVSGVRSKKSYTTLEKKMFVFIPWMLCIAPNKNLEAKWWSMLSKYAQIFWPKSHHFYLLFSILVLPFPPNPYLLFTHHKPFVFLFFFFKGLKIFL